MRSFCTHGMALTLGMVLAASGVSASAGDYGSPALLPLPDSGPQLAAPGPSSRRASLLAPQYAGTQPIPTQPTPAAPIPAPPESAPQLPAPVQASPSDAPLTGGKANGTIYDEAAACGWGDDCSANLPSCCNQCFASFAGLVMGRNLPNPFWTSYETNNNVNQVLNTRDANADWRGGGEIRFGTWFGGGGCGCADGCQTGCGGNCNRCGIEVVYFTLSPFQGFASVRGDSLPGGSVSTPIDLNNQFGPVMIGANTAASFFDGATEHRIWRNDELHNVELNLLNQQIYNTGNAQVTWLGGVRYFRFDDSLIFGSVAGGSEFGDNAGPNVGGAAQAYLSSRAVNNLVGFQIGARADYYLTPGFSVFATPKIGIYGNSISVRNRLYTGDGIEGFDITGNSVDFSMLAQIDLGMSYQFHPNWRAFLGYRAIAVTQVALADNQFLPFLADTQGFGDPKTNGSLVLHGAFAGLECRF